MEKSVEYRTSRINASGQNEQCKPLVYRSTPSKVWAIRKHLKKALNFGKKRLGYALR
jgi:hypothetical protein